MTDHLKNGCCYFGAPDMFPFAFVGKTVQVVALLAGLLKKTGTKLDALVIKARQDHVAKRQAERQLQKQQALEHGRLLTDDIDIKEGLTLPQWSPILIIVPPSVEQHWLRDLATWGYFAATSYGTSGLDSALEQIRTGYSEIFVLRRSCFEKEEVASSLQTVDWKVVIIDEFHAAGFKNSKSRISENLRRFKQARKCPIIGLSGTLMQNNHQELWNLIDLVETNYFGSWDKFKTEIADPIKYSL